MTMEHNVASDGRGSNMMPGASISEVTLLDPLVLKERVDVFRQTAEERRTQLLRVARRITNSSEDSEDILQDALLKAYLALPKFRGEARMSTWLNAIVQNTAIEHLRSRRGRVLVSLECLCGDGVDTIGQRIPDPRETAEEELGRVEMEGLLRSEISKLGVACRRALELCVLDGYSQAAAALALDVRIETVKSRVFRGKRMLGRLKRHREAPRERK